MIMMSILIVGIGTLFVSNDVFAAEIFKDGNTTYSIEKTKLNKELLDGNEYFIEIDKDNNYIFKEDAKEVFYKVNEKECNIMEAQEVLAIMNSTEDQKYYSFIYLEGYDVYRQKFAYFTEIGFIKTKDTDIIQLKYIFNF